MIYESVGLFFVLLDIIICAPPQQFVFNPKVKSATMSSSVPNNQVQPTTIFKNELILEQLLDNNIVSYHRNKRGIVLIDEDLDVPPEPGVKHGWSDGDFDEDTSKIEKDLEMTSTKEGKEPTTSAEEVSSTRTTRNMTPEKLQMSTDKQNTTVATITTDFTDIEGSGEITEHYILLTSTTLDTKGTEEPFIFNTCLNLTCNSQDLIISPGISEKVPEGTNLTLSCSTANASEYGMLKLYKHNDSNNSLLRESSKEQKLLFDIKQSQQHDSGTYMCLRFTEESCCHKQLDITVYEIPNYKYHLIIVGLVAAVSLFICVLLGIRKKFKAKKQQEQLELQNLQKPIVF